MVGKDHAVTCHILPLRQAVQRYYQVGPTALQGRSLKYFLPPAFQQRLLE